MWLSHNKCAINTGVVNHYEQLLTDKLQHKFNIYLYLYCTVSKVKLNC